MATRNPDGSIMLEVNIDADTLESAMAQLEKGSKQVKSLKFSFSNVLGIVEKFAGAIVAAFSVNAIVEFSKQSSTLAAQAEASTKRLIDIYGEASDIVGDFIDNNAKMLGMSKTAAASYAATYGNLFSSWADQATNAEVTNEFLKATAVIASKTGRTLDDVQDRIRSGLLGNTESIEDLGVFVNVKTIEMTKAFKKLSNGKSWAQLDTYTQQQIMSYAILEQSAAKYGTEVEKTFNFQKEALKSSYEDFQNTWGSILNEILLPVLDVATQILEVFNETLSKIGQVSTSILGNQKEQVEATEQTSINQKQIKDNVEDTAKAQKKSVASFDTIQRLSAETAKNTTADKNSTVNPNTIPDTSSTGDTADVENDISRTLAGIAAIVGQAMLVIGVLLVCTGAGIGLGIALIIAGAASWATAVALDWNYLDNKTGNALEAAMLTISDYMLVLGVILLFGGVGTAGLGLALIAGAVTAKAIDPDYEYIFSKIKEVFGKIKEYWDTEIKPFTDQIGEELRKFVDEKILPGYNDKIKPQLDELKQNLQNLWNKVVNPILSFIGEKFKKLWDEYLQPIGDKFKELWIEYLKDELEKLSFWFGILCEDTESFLTALNGLILFITGVFTGDWELAWDGIAKIFEGFFGEDGISFATWLESLIKEIKEGDWKGAWDVAGEAFKVMINLCISNFEKLINRIVDGLNAIVPSDKSVVGQLTGLLGFDISKLKLDHVQLPRLAKGAVIPPNQEFLAVLGDQKKGTNIETPLKTMIEAFTTALDSRGGTDITVNFTGTESQLLRYLSPKIEVNNKYRGKNLLTGRQV